MLLFVWLFILRTFESQNSNEIIWPFCDKHPKWWNVRCCLFRSMVLNLLAASATNSNIFYFRHKQFGSCRNARTKMILLNKIIIISQSHWYRMKPDWAGISIRDNNKKHQWISLLFHRIKVLFGLNPRPKDESIIIQKFIYKSKSFRAQYLFETENHVNNLMKCLKIFF